MKKIFALSIFLFFQLTVFAGATYKLEKWLNVRDAMGFPGSWGIKGSATAANQIEVRVFYKRYYGSGGRGSNALLFGKLLNKNSTNNHGGMGFQVGTRQPAWLCNINPFCTTGAFENSIFSDQESYYKERINKAFLNTLGSSADEFVVWAHGTQIRVIVEVELKGNRRPKDVQSVNLPGIGVIPFSEFTQSGITFENNFIQFARPDGKVTVVSHRGYWEKTGVVQNSLKAISAAAALSGAEGIEIDVRSTKEKHPILFHDDKPQKILQDIPNKQNSVYDYNWSQLKNYSLYDRFNKKSTEKLTDLATAFKHIRDKKINKIINIDIGIPAQVPQNGKKVDGKPFADAVFLESIRLACEYNISNRVLLKGNYAWNDPIWKQVSTILRRYAKLKEGKLVAPRIAYTARVGDNIANWSGYINNWLDVSKGSKKVPGLKVVGIEVFLKTWATTARDKGIKNMIPKIKQAGLAVATYSETPASCQGYWTKSAVERYVDTSEDQRNDFEWLLSNGFNYVITDLPVNLVSYRNKKLYTGDQSSGIPWKTDEPKTFKKWNLSKGFTFELKGKPESLRNKVLYEVIKSGSNVAYYRIGMDNGYRFYVDRFITQNGKRYRWRMTLWETEEAQYTNYRNKEVYFAFIQEPGELRLHVGLPNGKFGCTYSDYAWKNITLAASTQNPTLKVRRHKSIADSKTRTTFKAYCRTDIFQRSIDWYFKPIGKSSPTFGLIDHNNKFTGKSDLKNDAEVNKDDNKRLGKCQYFQNRFSKNSGARVASTAADKNVGFSEIAPESRDASFSVYPNPNQGIIHLNVTGLVEDKQMINLNLYNLQGKLEASKVFSAQKDQNELVWDLSDGKVSTGVYVLKTEVVGQVITRRVVMDCGCDN